MSNTTKFYTNLELRTSLKSSYRWLQDKKIAFGVLDNSKRSKNETIKNVSKNAMEFWIEQLCKQFKNNDMVKIHSDADKLLEWASENNFNYLVVSSLGTTYKKKGHSWWKELENFFKNDPDFAIIGHILDRKEKFYELHEQTFVVNINWWKKVEKPNLGDRQSTTKSLPNVIRSDENHHDDYTPLWIKKGIGNKKYSQLQFGWNIITKALQSGYTIESFNERLRVSKHYFYPETKFESMKHTYLVHKQLQSHVHFIANTEDTYKVNKDITGSFDTVVCTAGGFTPIILAWRTDLQPNSKVIVMDTSHLAIKFSRDIVDGVTSKSIDIYNFESTLKKMMLNYMPDDHRNTVYDRYIFQSQDNIKPMQKLYSQYAGDGLAEYISKTIPTIQFNWILEDVFNVNDAYERISKASKGCKKVLLNLSNVYTYYNTSLFYDFHTRHHLHRELLKKLHKENHKKFWVQQSSYVYSLMECIKSSEAWENRMNKTIKWKNKY